MTESPDTPERPDDAAAQCAHCGEALAAEESFCTACGKPGTDAAEAPRRPSRARRNLERRDAKHRERQVKRASIWLLVIAALYLIAGTVTGMRLQSAAASAHELLAEYDDEERIPDEMLAEMGDADFETFGELRAAVDAEVTIAFVQAFVLGGIMILLFLWARRSPVPAFVTALCVFVVVTVVATVIEPSSLLKGIPVKILTVLLLLAGIKAALASRPDPDTAV